MKSCFELVRDVDWAFEGITTILNSNCFINSSSGTVVEEVIAAAGGVGGGERRGEGAAAGSIVLEAAKV